MTFLPLPPSQSEPGHLGHALGRRSAIGDSVWAFAMPGVFPASFYVSACFSFCEVVGGSFRPTVIIPTV